MKKALFSIFILLSFTSIVKANTINELYNELNSLKEAKELYSMLTTTNIDDINEKLLSVNDIVDNPKGIQFQELEAAQVSRVVGEVAFVVLNGNYALEAGYSVGKDSIAYEKSDSEAAKTYVNIVAVKEGNENNEGIKALVDVLKSDEIKQFINDTYDGAVVPFEE